MNERADLPPLASPDAVCTPKPDPELLALPRPPRRERTAAALLMVLTAVASLAMVWALRGEVRYAFARPIPTDVQELATFEPSTVAPGTYVEARGMLGSAGAIRYARPLEGDSFRLQPVAGNRRIWAEIRVPEGMEGPRFVPPTIFAGRLVPFDQAGLRHAGLRRSVLQQTGAQVPADAWLLIDGASPRASRWAVALAALFTFFAVWNAVNVVRILRPVRDR